MTDTPQLLLAHHLKSLRLPTFLREYDKVAKQCAAEGIDHSRYLLRLAELELIDRERRMVERRIKAAKFPAVKSLPSHRSFPLPFQACCACPAGQRISFDFKVSVRCAPPNGADFDGLVSTIDSGHLGALYGCEAEEAALAG